MNNNNYSWNETLKFSWGHIIAFVSLIFISYVAFMGDFYMNGGDFTASFLKVLIIDALLLLTFIGAQMYKGIDEKFERSIIIERFLICLCPIVFAWAIIPYNHFWNVYGQRKQIETQFNFSIVKSKEMFKDYDLYANIRIENYQKMLENIIENKDVSKDLYTKCNFSENIDNLQKEAYVDALRLQLLSQNFIKLKNEATKWIDNSNQGTSVWNAFLVGNVYKISDAITNWNKTLINYSTPVMTNELITGNNVKAFDEDKKYVDEAVSSLRTLTNIYKEKRGVNHTSIISAIFLFSMLLFPYFLQKRNTRANGLYFLLPFIHKNKPVSPTYLNTSNVDLESINVTKETSSQSSNHEDLFDGTF